jgi:hypothetical protein
MTALRKSAELEYQQHILSMITQTLKLFSVRAGSPPGPTQSYQGEPVDKCRKQQQPRHTTTPPQAMMPYALFFSGPLELHMAAMAGLIVQGTSPAEWRRLLWTALRVRLSSFRLAY